MPRQAGKYVCVATPILPEKKLSLKPYFGEGGALPRIVPSLRSANPQRRSYVIEYEHFCPAEQDSGG